MHENNRVQKVGTSIGTGFSLLTETKDNLYGKPAGVLATEEVQKGAGKADQSGSRQYGGQ